MSLLQCNNGLVSAALLGVLCVADGGCARREDPAFARTPEGGVRGDETVTGTPARVTRFSSPPVIDGRLDEAAWSGAVALGPFVDTGGGGEAPAKHPVFAFSRVGWDDAMLYFGFVVRDGSPVAPFARQAEDPHLWSKASAVEIMLQPGDPGDNREYFEVQIDTAGAVFDTRWDDYNVPITGAGAGADRVYGHLDWSARAERASVVERGRFYTIEAALPWAAITSSRTPVPPRAGDVWRLNLYSFRDGQRLALGWSPIRGQGNFHKSARFGRIRFE